MHDPAVDLAFIAKLTGLPESSPFGKPLAVAEDNTRYMVKLMGLMRSGAPDSSRCGQASPLMASSGEFDIQPHRNCQALPTIHRQCPFHPDFNLPENIELHSLLIAHASGVYLTTGTQQKWKTEVGLVVTPLAGRRSQYRRVGYFHHDLQQDTTGIRHHYPSLFEVSEIKEIEIL
jgi:hypothetical protein